MVGIAAIGLLLQSHTYLNHDVSYILWGAREMLHGAQFGRDIIDPNPPLAWYLSAIPVWLAARLAIPLDLVFRLCVIFLGLLAIACVKWRWWRHPADSSAGEVRLLAVVAASFFFLIVGHDFGQREHVASMLILPYLTAAASRFEHQPRHARLSAVDLLAALMVGLGLAIKPFFYLIPVLVESAILLRHHRLRAVICLDTVLIPLAAAIYLCVIFVWARGYIDVALPWVRQIYWTFDAQPAALVQGVLLPGSALLILFYLFARGLKSSLAIIFGLAALGFFFAYMIQGKGFGYHLYPIATYAALALAVLLPKARLRRMALPLVTTCVLILYNVYSAAAWWLDYNKDFGESGLVLTEVIRLVDRPGGGGFLAISNHPIPAFPTAIYAAAPLVSRHGSQIYLHTLAALREGRLRANAKLQVYAEEQARQIIAAELAEKPGTVLVDYGTQRVGMKDSDFDFLAFFEEDEGFRRMWQDYREVAPIGRFRAFLRRSDLTVQP
ncbi:MAG: hypothetical protein HYU58_16930 [Proteobacteria bacterium]|nr:hypothetical protein [Pseudomonadota bacterium]